MTVMDELEEIVQSILTNVGDVLALAPTLPEHDKHAIEEHSRELCALCNSTLSLLRKKG